MNEEFWRSAQQKWQALAPGVQLVLVALGVFGAAFVTARAAGWLVGRRLRAAQFDAAFRRPWSPSPAGGRADTQPRTPTRLITGLVRLSVWGGGIWVLAYAYEWIEVI